MSAENQLSRRGVLLAMLALGGAAVACELPQAQPLEAETSPENEERLKRIEASIKLTFRQAADAETLALMATGIRPFTLEQYAQMFEGGTEAVLGGADPFGKSFWDEIVSPSSDPVEPIQPGSSGNPGNAKQKMFES